MGINTKYSNISSPETNVLEWLKEEDIDFEELDSRLPNDWIEIMNPDFVAFFRDGIEKNLEFPCVSNYQVGFNDKFCDAIMENDLTEILEQASYDVHICHSPFDDLVDFRNVPNFSRNPSHLSLTYSFGDHIEGAGICFIEILSF